MRCNRCLQDAAIEYSVDERLNVLGTAVFGSMRSVKCLACGHVDPDRESRRDFHLGVARALTASGVHSRTAFEYVARVLGLPDATLAFALGVSPETVRRWIEGLDPVPAEVMSVVARLLGPADPAADPARVRQSVPAAEAN